METINEINSRAPPGQVLIKMISGYYYILHWIILHFKKRLGLSLGQRFYNLNTEYETWKKSLHTTTAAAQPGWVVESGAALAARHTRK